MAYTAADRIMAVRHVEEGVRRIAAMRDDIVAARDHGHPTTLSEQALATMLRTLELMEAHLGVIEESLASPSGDPRSTRLPRK
jgi:hypothetical protein